jgi:hypothetical protein
MLHMQMHAVGAVGICVHLCFLHTTLEIGIGKYLHIDTQSFGACCPIFVAEKQSCPQHN